MKFTCNQQTLTKALNTVSKAVSNRTTLPILKGILLEAKENGTLVLTASDLEISIQKEIEASVDVPGSAVVVSKLFGDIIRKRYRRRARVRKVIERIGRNGDRARERTCGVFPRKQQRVQAYAQHAAQRAVCLAYRLARVLRRIFNENFCKQLYHAF